MEEVKNLLNEVAVLSQRNDKKLDATGARFNVFRLCGVNHYENQHSTILAEFLNPKGTHGLKEKLLESFVEMFCSDELKQKFHSGNARIFTEYSMDKGRIDILIEDYENHALIIENKVFAEDQGGQLKRYNSFAMQKYGEKNYQIIYLTLGGKDASSQSGEGVDYLKVSYGQHIIAWLEECVKITEDRPMVRETINQYINHIKLLTNQSLDMEFEKNVLEIMVEENNVDAVFHIAHTFNAYKEKIIEKFFQELAKEKEFYVIESKSLSDVTGRVFINSKENPLERNICFEFTSADFKNLAYGYKRKDEEKDKEPKGFAKFLVENDKKKSDWWFWKTKPGISFEESDIKQIAKGNSKELPQYKECLDCIEKLVNLKKEFEAKTKQ